MANGRRTPKGREVGTLVVLFIPVIALSLVVAEEHFHSDIFNDEVGRAFDDIHIVTEGGNEGDGEERAEATARRLLLAEEIGIEVDERSLYIEAASHSLDGVYLNPKVHLGERNGLRGLFALEDIEEGEQLATVPFEYFLSRPSASSRMQRILDVIKKEVFDEQHLKEGDWINVDFAPWEMQVVATLATIGIAEPDDTPESVAKLAMEFQLLDDTTLQEAAEHARSGKAYPFPEGLSKEEIAARWFFLGVPPYYEYAMGKGPLLETPSMQELSETEVMAMDWAFPDVNIAAYSAIDRRVYDYFSAHFYGRCFHIPATEDEPAEEACIRKLPLKFFRYMCAIASRYCFSISPEAAGQIGYVSLVNHGYRDTMHWGTGPVEFELKANGAVAQGEELLISYGGMGLRGSVFHYGFFDGREEMETEIALPFRNSLNFGEPSPGQCDEAVLAGLAHLPEDRVALYPFVLEPLVQPTAFSKSELGEQVAAGARYGLRVPSKTLRLHPYQRRVLQCRPHSSELTFFAPGYVTGETWRLLRLLHMPVSQLTAIHEDPDHAVGGEVECQVIDSLLLFLETQLALGGPGSPYSDLDLLEGFVTSMRETITQLQEMVGGDETEPLPGNTDQSRSHGVLNAVRVARAERTLLANSLAKLRGYANDLGCQFD